MLSGTWLYLVAAALAALLGALYWGFRNLYKSLRAGEQRGVRTWLATIGLGFAALSACSLLVIVLSWFSVGISQHFSGGAAGLLLLLCILTAVPAFFLSIAGSGRERILGIGASLAMGACWFFLVTELAISMGPLAIRHPTRYLIPSGFVGWVKIVYDDQSASPLPYGEGAYTCRIPESGVLHTSSLTEEGWAKDEYFYYSATGQLQPLEETGWGEGGMIWAGSTNLEYHQNSNVYTADTKHVSYEFFVGTEAQYHSGVYGEPRSYQQPLAPSPPR